MNTRKNCLIHKIKKNKIRLFLIGATVAQTSLNLFIYPTQYVNIPITCHRNPVEVDDNLSICCKKVRNDAVTGNLKDKLHVPYEHPNHHAFSTHYSE